MSELESAARCESLEGDCPICLEPLPPFWELMSRRLTICCGKFTCLDCYDQQFAYVQRACADGTFGRGEEQLCSTCPLCRAPMPPPGPSGRMLADKFEKGQLPLALHRELAVAYLKGSEGVENNAEKGLEMLMLGAERGDPRCSFALANEYGIGENVLKSAQEAKQWCLAAASQGHAIAEYKLAQLAEEEGNEPEYLRRLRGSAAKGYDEACYDLGMAHYEGKYGLQTSSEEAIRVVTQAAEDGHTQSMALLGSAMCCPEPWVDPRDDPNFTKGMHWMRRAAESGDEATIELLGMQEDLFRELCFMCGKKAPSANSHLRCSRCRAAWYCSKDCQVRHWKAEEGGHKQFCIKWTKDVESKKA